MQQVEKFYNENKKTIWLVAGIGAAVGLAIVVFNKVRGGKHAQVEVTPADNGNRGELSKLEKSNIIATIKVEYEGDFLTVRTITQITEAVIKFATPKFVQMAKEDRDKRRANRDNLDKYIELWDEYTQRLEEIVESSQKDVLKALNIHESVYESSISFHVGENNQELFMLHATLPQRLKTTLKPTKKLSLNEFKEILRVQIEVTNKEAANIKRISEKTKHPEEAAPIIGNIVNDIIYSKYTVEEEDLFAVVQLFSEDNQVQQLMGQLQIANMKLLPMPEGLF